jgi:hypothetical protein
MSDARLSERIPHGYDGKTPWMNLLAHQKFDWLIDHTIGRTPNLNALAQVAFDRSGLSMTMPWANGVTESFVEERTTVTLQNGRSLVFDTNPAMKALGSPARITWKAHQLSSGEIWVVPYYRTKNGPVIVMRSEETAKIHVMCIGTIQLGQLIPDGILSMVHKTEDVRKLRAYGTTEEAYWSGRDIIEHVYRANPRIQRR